MSAEGEKIALFIDGANLYATAKSLGFDIDYKRLRLEFQQQPLVVDVEAQGFGGGVEICAVDEKCDFFAFCGHDSSLQMNVIHRRDKAAPPASMPRE